MPETALARVIRHAAILEYDDLRDLSDALTYYMQTLDPDRKRPPNVPRHGRPPTAKALYHHLIGVAQSAPDRSPLVAAFAATLEAVPAAHALDDLRAVHMMVAALIRALAPQEKRRDGRGYIETRYMPRLKYNVDTDEWTVVYFGPYAYLRRWATGGGRDRKRDTLKSHYLGKDVAVSYLSGVLTLDDILAAFEAGTLDALKADAQEADLPDPDDKPADQPFNLHPTLRDAIDEKQINAGDLNRMFSEAVLSALDAGLIDQEAVLVAYLEGEITAFKRGVQGLLDDPEQSKLRNAFVYRNKDDFRPRPHHLKLLKKAAKAEPARPAYVSPDSAAHGHVQELVTVGLMTTFRRDGRRVYYQLTEAGQEVAGRGFHNL